MRLFIFCVVVFGLVSGGFSQTPEQEMQAREAANQRREAVTKQQFMMRMINVAQNPRLRKELEIVDDQIVQLRSVAQNFQKELADSDFQKKAFEAQRLIGEGKREEGMELMRDYQQFMSDLCDDYIERVGEIFLPHQIKRMQQISRQETLKSFTQFGDEFGIAYAVSDVLELDDKTKKELKLTIEEARKEYYEELKKIKERAHKKILAAIPAEKREKLKDLVGEIYDLNRR